MEPGLGGPPTPASGRVARRVTRPSLLHQAGHNPAEIVSGRKRLNQKWQTFIHSIVDPTVIVGELFVAVRDTAAGELPHKPASPKQKIELIPLPAIDVERLQIS